MFYVQESISITKDFLAGLIDHTLLSPDATPASIINLCEEAIKYNFYSVCVNSFYVPLVKGKLKDSQVMIASVVSFPLGAMTTLTKRVEAENCVQDGADEIDMVMNIGLLKGKQFNLVEEDIREVVKAVSPKIVKVIIETCLLTEQEKIIASAISVSAGAKFVKTSTGFSKGGATVEDVQLIRSVVGTEIGVKASGGIRDFETAVRLVKAGASRIGASKSVEIVK